MQRKRGMGEGREIDFKKLSRLWYLARLKSVGQFGSLKLLGKS